MTVRWHDGWTTLYLGDVAGNPVPVHAGIVEIDHHIKVGLRYNQDFDPCGKPDYTIDVQQLNDILSDLGDMRAKLVAAISKRGVDG
jgi:hypothetical protein